MQYTEDSISHMDSNTPVLVAGSYKRLLSMEASLAALFDSSPGMAERRRSAVQSLKHPSIPNVARDEPEWFFSVPPWFQTIENSMAETLERFESTSTSLPRSEASRSDRLRTVRRLWQRRVRLWRTDDALQSGLSSGVPCRTSLLAIHHCWRRCWDV